METVERNTRMLGQTIATPHAQATAHRDDFANYKKYVDRTFTIVHKYVQDQATEIMDSVRTVLDGPVNDNFNDLSEKMRVMDAMIQSLAAHVNQAPRAQHFDIGGSVTPPPGMAPDPMTRTEGDPFARTRSQGIIRPPVPAGAVGSPFFDQVNAPPNPFEDAQTAQQVQSVSLPPASFQTPFDAPQTPAARSSMSTPLGQDDAPMPGRARVQFSPGLWQQNMYEPGVNQHVNVGHVQTHQSASGNFDIPRRPMKHCANSMETLQNTNYGLIA